MQFGQAAIVLVGYMWRQKHVSVLWKHIWPELMASGYELGVTESSPPRDVNRMIHSVEPSTVMCGLHSYVTS